MTNKNSTAFIFKTYRQPITVINLTGVNFNQGKDTILQTIKKVFRETHHSSLVTSACNDLTFNALRCDELTFQLVTLSAVSMLCDELGRQLITL